jgi:hypothetical protein
MALSDSSEYRRLTLPEPGVDYEKLPPYREYL